MSRTHYPVSALECSSPQPKKQTHSLLRDIMREDSVIFLNVRCPWLVQFPEDLFQNGPEMVLGYLFTVSQAVLSALEQSWLHDN